MIVSFYKITTHSTSIYMSYPPHVCVINKSSGARVYRKKMIPSHFHCRHYFHLHWIRAHYSPNQHHSRYLRCFQTHDPHHNGKNYHLTRNLDLYFYCCYQRDRSMCCCLSYENHHRHWILYCPIPSRHAHRILLCCYSSRCRCLQSQLGLCRGDPSTHRYHADDAVSPHATMLLRRKFHFAQCYRHFACAAKACSSCMKAYHSCSTPAASNRWLALEWFGRRVEQPSYLTFVYAPGTISVM